MVISPPIKGWKKQPIAFTTDLQSHKSYGNILLLYINPSTLNIKCLEAETSNTAPRLTSTLLFEANVTHEHTHASCIIAQYLLIV